MKFLHNRGYTARASCEFGMIARPDDYDFTAIHSFFDLASRHRFYLLGIVSPFRSLLGSKSFSNFFKSFQTYGVCEKVLVAYTIMSVWFAGPCFQKAYPWGVAVSSASFKRPTPELYINCARHCGCGTRALSRYMGQGKIA